MKGSIERRAEVIARAFDLLPARIALDPLKFGSRQSPGEAYF